MRYNFVIIFVLSIIWLESCSYIPFQPKCERIPPYLSFMEMEKHFGREPDLTRYNSIPKLGNRLSRYTYYYWGVCGGTSSAVFVKEKQYLLDSSGIPALVGDEVYVSLIQMGIEEIKSRD